MIKIMGLRGLKEAVEYRAAMAKFAESLILKNKDFIPFNKMDLYRMAFAYCPVYIKEYINSNKKLFTPEISASVKKLISKYDHIINQSLYEAGELCLDEYKLLDVDNGIGLGLDDPYLIMAMALGNPLYTEKSIKKSLGILFKKANKHKAEMIEEFLRITKSEGNIVDYSKRQSGPASW